MISPTQLNTQLNPETSTPRETGIKNKETKKQKKKNKNNKQTKLFTS
jgi:hypothetical protein